MKFATISNFKELLDEEWFYDGPICHLDALICAGDPYWYYVSPNGVVWGMPYELIHQMSLLDDDVYGWLHQGELDGRNFPLTYEDVVEMKQDYDERFGQENVSVFICTEGGYSVRIEGFDQNGTLMAITFGHVHTVVSG